MKTNIVKFKIQNNLAVISLNRPEKRNALNLELIQALTTAFQKIRASQSSAVLLKSEGSSFSAGADLKWLNSGKHFNKKNLKKLFSLLQLISDCPLPVIAYAKGYAIGGGIGLLSACDIIIAEQNTKFCFTETKLGLAPSIIAPFVLKKIGFSQAKFYMLSAEVFKAKTAKEISLVHFTGSRKNCLSFLNRTLKNINTLDKTALKQTKKLLRDINNKTLQSVKTRSVNLISKLRQSSEAKKRMAKIL